MTDEIDRALHKFPDTFRNELAGIRDGAKNGGVIPPRRRGGVQFQFDQIRKKYDQKIAHLRGHERSNAIDETDSAIAKIAAEFSADLAVGAAA